ncbi:MAG: hypothetical protein IJZ39_09905 [Oscillospiraceae bacterium]|nr:hypothetical protein [Oscillospiraceae bacterium]
MLYVTTRSDRDAFTLYRAMTTDTAPDGGQYLPRQMPQFSAEDLDAASQRSFNENIAYVLCQLYGAELTGRDIELVIGKRSAHILDLDSRTMICEIWPGSDCTFDETVNRLFRLLVHEPDLRPGQWFVISVRIALLFAVYAQLMAQGAKMPLDIALPSMDFQTPMAAWYARSWGLPVGTIICACNENNAPWSLLHQGELRTDCAVRRTITAACDQAVPAGLERLISAVLGADEVKQYLSALDAGRLYSLEAAQRDMLRGGLSVAVISRRRLEFMIPNLYRSGCWQPDLYTAMAYAALADHRATTGETGKALIIAEENPLYSADILAKLLNIPADHLRRRLENM